MGDQILLDEIVQTSYGQFTIEAIDDPADGWNGDADRFFAGQVNGWVGAAEAGNLVVVLGRWGGGSSVRITSHDVEPEPDEQWEDVVEVSFAFDEFSELRWASWAGESSGPLVLDPGSYRVRVSARGRDAGSADESTDEVVDWYLIQFWPAEDAPDAIVRTSSENAQYWHTEWGSRRGPQVPRPAVRADPSLLGPSLGSLALDPDRPPPSLFSPPADPPDVTGG